MTAEPTDVDLPEPKTFADMGVDERICAALADRGITVPFPIQELTLPLGLSGADVIGQARTGTGKTLAFGIPLLQRVDARKGTTQALVVVPTRELCMQVRDDLDRASARTDVRVVAVYGGKAIDPQAEELASGSPVVVGTPGRLLDLRRRGVLDLSGVVTLVLDEADEMLDLGFLPDVERIIEATDPARQTLLFSATMPSAVVALARRYMRKPTFLRADVEESRIAPETRQFFFACHPMDKPAVLARILQAPGRGLCVAFTRTKRMADTLAAELRDRGLAAAPIHSDLRQEARERAMARFRAGKVDVLVATEVAARGLDITDVTHVINYDCPDDDKMYLHRIGRTGRAGAAGAAITLAVWHEQTRLEVIKKALAVEEPTHEVFSTSPILDELFDLPARPNRPRIPSEPSPRAGARRGGGRRPARDRPRAGGGARARDAGPTQDKPRIGDAGPNGNPGDRAAGEDAEGDEKVRSRSHAQPPDAGPEAVRRRTRRRSKRSTGSAAAEPSEAAGTATSSEDGDEPRREPDAGTPRGSGPSRDPGDDGEAAHGTGPDGGTDGERRERQRSSGRRSGRRPRRGGRRQPAPRRSSAGDAAAPVAHHRDAGALRGDGRPRLNRPLSIAHLP